MACCESFQNKNATEKRNFILKIVAAIAVLTVVVIVILLIATPKVGNPVNGPPDRIACPGFYNKKSCEAQGCAYETTSDSPSCYMKKDSFGYKVVEATKDGKKATLSSRSEKTPYGPSLTDLIFEVSYITENIVRVKFYDPKNVRYEVPVQKDFPLLAHRPPVDISKLAYNVSITNKDIFAFQIQRTDGTVLWDTSIGGLVLSDQYLQIASYLPSKNIYGLGEHTHKSLRHDLYYNTWPLFARDRAPLGGEINLYGVHPFYTCLEKNTTKSHGVLLLNSNAMEVTFMPKPAISYRTIGGVLDFFYFVGDNPEHVVQLYTSLIGRPMMPPYWGLGFQLSRYGYNKLENVKNAVERTRKANIAQDVQYLDIDHMYQRRDFTYDNESFAGLIEYIEKTKQEYDLKWIIILDPAIEAVKGYEPYDNGLEKKVFIKRSSTWKPDIFPPEVRENEVVYGKVWPTGVVAFPDFLNSNTHEWWIKTIADYHNTLPFDGLWIDMNEPANFGTNEEKPFYCKTNDCWSLKCPASNYENPPYNPLERSGSDRISMMTLCMDSVQNDGTKDFSHYNVHSLYGLTQTLPTLLAAESATGTRSLVISRSTYPSSGRYGGHWLGDNKSTWTDLKNSVIGMLEFNLFGIPYIGADVCGFNGDTTEELCIRWMQLGAFYPFFRNHNEIGRKDQDPAALGPDVEKASRAAVGRRYNFQPYLYTLFYRAHVDGSTVIRPVFHEFPADETTWDMGEQFMWGRCILASPILRQGAKTVQLYLPEGEDWWLFNYNNTILEKSSGYVERGDIDDNIPMHVRGSCVIPTEPYRLKDGSKKARSELELYVFLTKGMATGELFIDDGLSKDTIENKKYALFKFTAKDCNFELKNDGTGSYDGEYPTLTMVHFFTIQAGTEPSPEVAHVYLNKKLSEVGNIKIPIKECGAKSDE